MYLFASEQFQCLFLLPEQKEVRDKERSAIKAREAFDELDLNKDGL